MKVLGKPVYRFDDVEVDASQGCLKRFGQQQYLRQQTFQVLLYLLEQRERLVTKDELIECIWKGMAVTDNALVQCVVDIRRALGDDSRHPRLIKTVSKVGYRFIGQVEELYRHEAAAIEMEEVTSVEVEFEEEITDETHGSGDTETRREPKEFPLPSHFAASLHSRVILVALIAILVAVSLFIYVRPRMVQSNRPAAEVRLPQAPGKKPLAVMYFDNQSASAELDWLREGLADMLIADLSRSKNLTVLSRQQLHTLVERLGRGQSDRTSLDDALDIGRRSQAEAIIVGSFARLGERVRIDVQLHSALTGQVIASEGFIADKPDQILSQVDLLSLKIAADLGAGVVEQANKNGLADVRTNSLEAYRYYSLALEKAEGLHNIEAIALLEKAVALDPEFAMAYARIGYAYAVTWDYADTAKPYLEKAFQLSHRLSDKDRLYISAWYAITNQDSLGAIRLFQEIISHYPLESEAYFRSGRLLMGEDRFEEATAVLKQGLVIDPESRDICNVLGSTYAALGKREEAVAMHQRYVALAPDEPNAYDSLGLTYQWAGQYDVAMAEYNRALALNPHFEVALIHLSNVYVQSGKYREAINYYQQYIQVAPSDLERARGYRCIAMVYLKKGEPYRADEAVKKAMRFEKKFSWAPLLIAVEQGDPARAQRLKEEFVAAWPYMSRGAKFTRRYLSYYDGRIAFRSGRVEDAIERFKETLRHAPIYWEIDPFEDCLANAYLELGQFDEAITEYERILGINPNYPLAHYHLGQAYERKGQPDRARAEYENFLHAWDTADPDVPEIVAAKKRLTAES